MTESRAAEKARKIAEKYSGAGQSFQVKYLGTQEVSSAKGDAVIADCLKELRTLFMEVASHLPKVNITLQMGGITVTDEKSKLEFVKAPLETISYVCLDPADNSVFSLIIRSNDTISSKGLRLHAFIGHPQTAITFNRSARELFDFMARIMRAKKKLAQQEASQAAMPHAAIKTSATPHQDPGVVPALAPPPPVSSHQPSPQLSVPAVEASVVAAGLADEEKRQEAVFAEWKELERELDDIGQELGIEPTTSTPTSSSPTSSAVAAEVSSASVPSQLQPTPLDVLTASGSDPFNSSFFDLSFGTSQPVATNTTAAVSHDSNNQHIFNNPVFNTSTDKAESTPESKMSVALTSTPESKQLTYQSRPRPKGKSLDSPTVFSPAPLSEITNGTDTGGRAVRDISLSPTAEQEVKSILANTDPFQSPTTFQSPPPAINGSGPFGPAPFPQTPDSSFFSFSAQDSIQLVNPLYQSPSLDGSFSAPYISPPQPLQQPAMMVQPQPPVAPPPLMPLIQPPHMMTQPQLSNSMGANSFDGIFSPTIYSPPSTGESLWSAQSPPEDVSFIEQRDQMFADLLPLGAHSLPDKKKEFEPQKFTSPSLAELQDKKRREQEEAFIASTSITKETLDEANKWPTSPFDAVTVTDSTEIPPEPPLNRSPQLLSEILQAPTSTTKQQNAQVNTLDDFDRAFQEASKEVEDIDSAFEVKTTVIPQPQPSGPATNDPFVVNGSATSPELKNAPWSTF